MRTGGLRGLSLAAVALALPACDGSNSTLGGTVLFSDGFSQAVAPDPASWTVALNGGTVAQDPAGSPGPCVAMTGSINDNPEIVSVASYATPSLSLSVRAAAAGTPALKGTGIITVEDAGNGLTATATWDVASGNLAFDIDGDGATVPAPAADGGFAIVVFRVDGAGVATWTMDGVLQLTGAAPWPAGMVTLTLGADIPGGGGNPATFRFDTVIVSTP